MANICNQFLYKFLNITYSTTPPQLRNKFIKYMCSFLPRNISWVPSTIEREHIPGFAAVREGEPCFWELLCRAFYEIKKCIHNICSFNMFIHVTEACLLHIKEDRIHSGKIWLKNSDETAQFFIIFKIWKPESDKSTLKCSLEIIYAKESITWMSQLETLSYTWIVRAGST